MKNYLLAAIVLALVGLNIGGILLVMRDDSEPKEAELVEEEKVEKNEKELELEKEFTDTSENLKEVYKRTEGYALKWETYHETEKIGEVTTTVWKKGENVRGETMGSVVLFSEKEQMIYFYNEDTKTGWKASFDDLKSLSQDMIGEGMPIALPGPEKVVGEEKINGLETFVTETKTSSPFGMPYTHRYWISKVYGIPIKIEMEYGEKLEMEPQITKTRNIEVLEDIPDEMFQPPKDAQFSEIEGAFDFLSGEGMEGMEGMFEDMENMEF